jgi:hypothetical protein
MRNEEVGKKLEACGSWTQGIKSNPYSTVEN